MAKCASAVETENPLSNVDPSCWRQTVRLNFPDTGSRIAQAGAETALRKTLSAWLFLHWYTKFAFVEQELEVSRITATKYSDELAAQGFLFKRKIGRSKHNINVTLDKTRTSSELRSKKPDASRIKSARPTLVGVMARCGSSPTLPSVISTF
jgi:hypothetical protein